MHDPIKFQPGDDPDPPIPDALRADLARLSGGAEHIDIPPEVDQRMAHMARWRLSGRVAGTAGKPRGISWSAPPRRRLLPMRLLGITAAAAALLLVALLSPRIITPGTPSAGTTIALLGDVDADGRVDVIDALLLAKAAQHDSAITARVRSTPAAQDINADGAITGADALALRDQIVKLPLDTGKGGAG